MKKITILAVGKESKQFCKSGCDEYLKRLAPFYEVNVVEIAEKPTVAKEGEEILKKLSGLSVLMDICGEELSSTEFASFLKSAHETCDKVTFIIGGASGVSETVKEACKKKVSFGKVTYPHQIARLLLLEQLYRAATIINGLPYHK